MVQCQSMDNIQNKCECNYDKKIILVLGYTEVSFDANSCPLNFILMIIRYYIFKCVMKGSDLNAYQVQLIAKKKFIEQELLSKINNKSDFKTVNVLSCDLSGIPLTEIRPQSDNHLPSVKQ